MRAARRPAQTNLERPGYARGAKRAESPIDTDAKTASAKALADDHRLGSSVQKASLVQNAARL